MAGMALNDFVDIRFDREQRPERPMAAGRISPRAALIFIAACFVTGLVLLMVTFAHCLYLGLVLAAVIILYNITHKRHAYAVLFMGACRALIYVICAYAIVTEVNRRFWQVTIFASGLLALYILFVTWIARRENSRHMDQRRWLAIAILCLVPAACLVSWPTPVYAWAVAVVLLIILSGATRAVWCDPPRIKQAVMTWLACLCLLDSLFLCTLANPAAAGIAGVCFVVVTWGHRKIKGT